VIDADGHVMETVDWRRALPEELRDLVGYTGRPRRRTDSEGRLVLDSSFPEDLQFPIFAGHRRANPRYGRAPAFHGPVGEILSTREGNRAGMWDPGERIKDMERAGTWGAVLYPSIMLSLSGLEHGALASALACAYNDWLAAYCRPYPDRLFGVAALAMQDPEAAALELRRAVGEHRFVAGFIATNARGVYPGERQFDPIWAEAERLDVPIAVHAVTGFRGIDCAGQDRFDRFIYGHLTSHPFDQMCALASIIYEGVLDRFPGVRVAFLEGQAGWAPWWIDRMDEHFEKLRPQAYCKKKPSEYFAGGRCYISCDPDEAALEAIAARIGPDHLLYASDYAHWDSIWPEDVAAIATRPELTDELKRKILAENATRLYRL
jgi:predicted TIM-barrel fold metal-dependent hydrolase